MEMGEVCLLMVLFVLICVHGKKICIKIIKMYQNVYYICTFS